MNCGFCGDTLLPDDVYCAACGARATAVGPKSGGRRLPRPPATRHPPDDVPDAAPRRSTVASGSRPSLKLPELRRTPR